MSNQDREVRRKAIALRYDEDRDAAPRVVAKGAGLVADGIRALAKEHGIHVHEDADLVEVLAKLDLGATVPEELYRAVAEVLAFVYRLNQRLKG